MNIHVYIYTYILYMCVCVYIYIYIWGYVSMYVSVCTYIHLQRTASRCYYATISCATTKKITKRLGRFCRATILSAVYVYGHDLCIYV